MCGRCYRDIILGYVDAERKALAVYVGEVAFCLFRILVGHVEVDMVVAV